MRNAAAVLAASWLVVLPARAALFDDEEARKRIDQTNQRVAQLQKQLEDRMTALEGQLKSQGLAELFSQVEQIKADFARLRGQIEVLNHEQEQSQKRQRDLYIDLDSRLRKLEGGPTAAAQGAAGTPTAVPGAANAPAAAASAAGAPAAAGAPTPSAVGGTLAARPATPSEPGNEQRAYDAAYDQFRAANYPAAISGFAAFVKAYPKSPLAPSAQYWIGNAQFAQKDYRGAIATQRQLIAAYPDSQKVPDALLNIATSQFELSEGAASRRTLEDLIAKYPKSEAAGKARARLGMR